MICPKWSQADWPRLPLAAANDCFVRHRVQPWKGRRTNDVRGGRQEADLAGPGIGNYEDLEKVLPNDYASALNRRETQEAIFVVKDYIERISARS